MRRLVAAVVAVILSLVMVLTVNADAGIDGGTNAFRQANGLAPLATSQTLTAIAQQRANAIVGNFAHDFSWWDSTGCSAVGENIAWRTGEYGADWAVNAWVNSAPHRANMLDASGYGFNVQGSALIHVNGNSYAVQVFGKCGSAPVPQPAPAAPQPPVTATQAPKATPAPAVTVLPDTALPTP